MLTFHFSAHGSRVGKPFSKSVNRARFLLVVMLPRVLILRFRRDSSKQRLRCAREEGNPM